MSVGEVESRKLGFDYGQDEGSQLIPADQSEGFTFYRTRTLRTRVYSLKEKYMWVLSLSSSKIPQDWFLTKDTD
jgi:hypothetical protein